MFLVLLEMQSRPATMIGHFLAFDAAIAAAS
jgi:hypothetical protein